jgi:hypothetical protein
MQDFIPDVYHLEEPRLLQLQSLNVFKPSLS